MISVELDIFSGRPNPHWILSDQEEALLVEQVVAEKKQMLPLSADTGGLGYRGYIITAMSEDAGPWHKAKLPSSFRLGGRSDRKADTSLWLLDTSEKPDTEVDDYLREVTTDSITGFTTLQEEDLIQPMGYAQSCRSNYLTSDTNFSFWNGSSYVTKNNCYNFASNYRSNTFAQPGLKAGKKYTAFTCSAVSTAVRYDGYQDNCLGGTASNISIVLVIWPNKDFHFYRLCANRRWCHKPGPTPAKNTDSSGRLISSVETCDRGPYTSVCGYFFANKSVVVR